MTSGLKADLRNMWLAILGGGAGAGAADIVSAIANRRDPLMVLQYIASGLIGKIAFEGGWFSALAGLAVHFGLTTIMAALFVLAARRWAVLWQKPWPAGLCYGVLVYVAMFYVIVPHSAAQAWKTPEGFWRNVSAAMGHAFFVGLPIASAARHFLGRNAARLT